MADLTDLIKRIEEGRGEDRELDAALHMALFPKTEWIRYDKRMDWLIAKYEGAETWVRADLYTAKHDGLAALSRLQETILPKWKLEIFSDPEALAHVILRPPKELIDYGYPRKEGAIFHPSTAFNGVHKELPRAYGAAILRAVMAKETDNG